MANNKLIMGEEELKGSSPYAPFALNELEKGDSVCFYFKETNQVTSHEFGEFTVMNGVKFDCNADTIEKLKSSMGLTSMPANTMLLNKIASGVMRPGNAYRIEKAWNKGDKSPSGKRAKGHGYNIFKLMVPDAVLAEFDSFINSSLGTKPINGEIAQKEEADTAPRPKI